MGVKESGGLVQLQILDLMPLSDFCNTPQHKSRTTGIVAVSTSNIEGLPWGRCGMKISIASRLHWQISELLEIYGDRNDCSSLTMHPFHGEDHLKHRDLLNSIYAYRRRSRQ